MKEKESDESKDAHHECQTEYKHTKKSGSPHAIVYVLIIAAITLLVYNQFAIAGLGQSMQSLKTTSIATGNVAASVGTTVQQPTQQLNVIPTGTPPVYGEELGISYDDISPSDPQKADETIEKLASYDKSIKLSGDDLQRYIKIGGQISCEYCCGAQSVIFTKDAGQYKAGDAACGCAHSYAMRGVAKYLLTQHGDEFTDDQILEEMGKLKTLFFPAQLTSKAGILQQKGIDVNYINLASNKYRGIEKQSSSSGGGMVGGC